MREIDQEKRRKEIAEELTFAQSWRVDFTCLESEVATNRLKRALQRQGIRLLIDPDASDLQRLRFKTPYAILVENISQHECLAMLAALRQVDLQEQKRGGEQSIHDVKLGRLSAADEGRLESLFGVKEMKPEEAGGSSSAAYQWPRGQCLGACLCHLARAEFAARAGEWTKCTPRRRFEESSANPTSENQLFLNSRQPPRPIFSGS